MKKTVFTICSVLTVCAVIIMSCEKEDTSAKKVYYNTQPGYSTGGNPNPNGVATSGGSATTTGTSSSGTSTTGASCTNAMTVNSVTCTSPSAAAGVSGTYVIVLSGSCIQIQVTFPSASAPTSGTYQIVSSGPVGNQCTMAEVGGSFAAGGSVTITTGSPNKITYSGVVMGTNTASGTGCY